LDFLVLSRRLDDGGHIIGEAKLLECFGDVVAGNRLLGLLFGDLVGFGGDEGDEFDTAFYEEIASFLGEAAAAGRWENFCDDFLDGS